VVLADEINRAPPRTQSGLLQAMQEGRVTIDDQTFELPQPFLVLATQNPLEHHGTYPLPESQLDRFLMRLSIGYPEEAAERRILMESAAVEPLLERLQPVLTPAEVVFLQNEVESVRADPSLVDYLLAIVSRTRASSAFRLGVSPRGSIALFRAARAHALTDGRAFLVPDDVRSVVVPCLAHRLLPTGVTSATLEAHAQSAMLLERILDEVEVPA
jgi:MoxR-like ATPase